MLLSCPVCAKPNFNDVDSLRLTLINVATSPLTCPVCKETLIGLDKLTIHLFRHVNNNNNNDDKNLIGLEENGECATSGNQKNKLNEYNDPLLLPAINVPETCCRTNQDNVETTLLTCDICNFEFTDHNILEMHQKLLHQTIPDKKTGLYSFHCHLCSKKFRMRGSLMVHLRVAHYGFGNHISATDSNADKNGPSETPTSTDAKQQWTCDVCAKLFTTKYFLKKHKRLHTGEMPYSCPICNKCFTFQQSYHKHMLYHSSEKPYMCNECGRAFKEHSTLQNHLRIHSGERPFACEICGKRFRQRVSYLVHTRIHTGVMPYKCTACCKSFRYKVSQKSHKCPINPPGSVIRVTEHDRNPPFNNNNNNNNIENPQKIMKNNIKENAIPCSSNNEKDTKLYDNNTNKTTTNGLQLTSSNDSTVYSTVMSSVILPEVESLCLNSSVSSTIINHSIDLIRDKCLEDLFQS